MSGTRLPTVRLPALVAGQGVDEDDAEAVVVELPSSNRFGIAWPAEPPPHMSAPSERPATMPLSSSEGETDVSEEEPSETEKKPARTEESDDSEFVTPTHHLNSDRDPMEQAGETHAVPRISRALSMPLPSQLGPFQHPRRSAYTSPTGASFVTEPVREPAHLEELSLELADSVQMVIQTLLQLSPPQVLDPAKEQFSACSLSIPTPSVSAMFTSMKNLNYMSANMSTFSVDPSASAQMTSIGRPKNESGSATYVDFDVAEMLQSVGDALSGVAAQAGVDLVLFHDDLGMRHIAVKGDESGISYTLSHVLRQIISIANRGDSIEVGLYIDSVKGPLRSPSPGLSPRSNSPHSDFDSGPLRCSFHIAHRFGMADAPSPMDDSGTVDPKDAYVPPSRNQPTFKSLILRRLLQHVDAQLDDVPSKGSFVGRCCVLATTLDRGSPSVVDPAVHLSPEDAAFIGYPADMRISHEPTLEQLTQFAESLKGRKVTLIAHSKGSFAQHLTSYLTAWGMDVSHVSTESDADGLSEAGEASPDHKPGTTREGVPSTIPEATIAPTSPPLGSPPTADPFILIDDDVPALRTRLQKLRTEQAYPLNLHTRKRPSLASNHRPRSSPQVTRVIGLSPQTTQLAPQVVIVHFTSLANFKLVKDAVQSMMVPGNSWTRLPEVIVVPKPAGPRRILTALHTAVTKPVVDPFFAPIATSPVSPSFHPMSPLFSMPPAQRSPGGRSTGSLRAGSDRSTRSPKDVLETVSLAPSSPLGMSDNIEYFSDAASRLGSSPASGLVIQSPDGQPAGIFFHPKSKGKSNVDRPPTESSGSSSRPRGSYRRMSDAESRRGLSVPQGELHRRGTRLSSTPEAPLQEPVYEVGTPNAAVKGKPRASSISEAVTLEAQPAATTTAEQAPSPTAPKLSRRTSQDPRHSPPLSPQARTPGASVTRRSSKRPTAESSASAPAAIPKKGTRGSENNIVPPISVLIVDDNPINQTILSTFMKKKKIKYDVAKNGEEAVQKWRSGGFHLILVGVKHARGVP
ncbi:Oxidative stress response two-component system protein SSK1 [Trametes pubescens]|uniref:Oxidative stress response two-component system protein SSK1 n=1 Tax=Trametes pubescens TaxID=154538 RepID=A0A1M2W0Q3_TRAPU|nr:Oxidative stress response two-component system protein SSK1 [Trametes pubescens]